MYIKLSEYCNVYIIKNSKEYTLPTLYSAHKKNLASTFATQYSKESFEPIISGFASGPNYRVHVL